VAGQALLIAMLGSLTYAIIEGPALGWRSPAILALFAVAAASCAAFAGYEARRAEPVLDPRFFRSAPFAGSVLTAIAAFAAMGGFLFLATLYLQDARGESALRAGLHIMPMALIMAPGAVLSSRILARRGARLPMLISGLGMAAGGVLLSRLTLASPTWPIVVAFCVFGVGAGMVNPPITYAAVSGMPTTQAGVASGTASTSRQVGQSLGVAITGSILAAGLHGPLRDGFVPASHAAWLLLAGCGAAVFLLGLVTTGRWALGTAARTAARYEDATAQKTPVTTRGPR
jgi:Na+/melibiose symporter-like transporter